MFDQNFINLAPEILIQYPENYSDQILKTAANFAYPCRIHSLVVFSFFES